VHSEIIEVECLCFYCFSITIVRWIVKNAKMLIKNTAYNLNINKLYFKLKYIFQFYSIAPGFPRVAEALAEEQARGNRCHTN